MKLIEKESVIAIMWRDACWQGGYDKHGLMDMTTVGLYVHEDKESITVAQDLADESYRNSVTIPKVNVRTITLLRKEETTMAKAKMKEMSGKKGKRGKGKKKAMMMKGMKKMKKG